MTSNTPLFTFQFCNHSRDFYHVMSWNRPAELVVKTFQQSKLIRNKNETVVKSYDKAKKKMLKFWQLATGCTIGERISTSASSIASANIDIDLMIGMIFPISILEI